MKRRIFLFNLVCILVLGGLLLASFQFYSIRERQHLIDERISLFLSSILSSEIDLETLDTIEDQVADSLGIENSVVLVTLYDPDEHLVFRNEPAKGMLADQKVFTLEKGFFSAHVNDHDFRGLNYYAHDSAFIVQVVLLRDIDDYRWARSAQNLFLVAAFLFLLSLLSAWVTTHAMLKNLESLSQRLYEFSRGVGSSMLAPGHTIPSWVMRSLKAADPIEKNLRDTLFELHEAQLKLKERFQHSLSLIAHELKTPLSVLTLALDDPKQNDMRIRDEIRHLNERLSELISWTRYDTGIVPQEELEALRLHEILAERVPQIQTLYPDTPPAKINCPLDLRILAPRRIFLLLIENLLINAFRHGVSFDAVEIVVTSGTLSVSNGGRVSPKVLERLGEPFNTDDAEPDSRSQGLGLAWIFSIARSLGWSFSIRQVGARVVSEISFKDGARRQD